MRTGHASAEKWSLFDREVPSVGYPLHVSASGGSMASPLRMDVHQGMEIGIVLQGQVERHFEDVVWVARPGDVHLCSAWEPHGWRVLEPGATEVVVIFVADVIDTSAFQEVPWLSFFTVPPAERPRTTPETRAEVLALGRRLHHEGQTRGRGWLLAARLLLHELLLILYRSWEPPQGVPRRAPVSPTSFRRVMPAVALVHADPCRHVSRPEAAAACGLHRSRFDTLFRQTMGVSFHDFSQRARLASVACLLLTTDLPTDAIAERTGFVDGSHLHRTFVHYYGITPGRYRARQRRTG